VGLTPPSLHRSAVRTRKVPYLFFPLVLIGLPTVRRMSPGFGSMRRPDSASVAAIPEWERGFYESAFTHSNVGRLTRHEGGFEALWEELAGKRKTFPAKMLIALPQTLAQFVCGN